MINEIFLKINCILSILISFSFFFFGRYTFLSFISVLMGIISTTSVYFIGINLLSYAFLWNINVAIWVIAILSFFVNIIILIDFFIFKIYKFHINGMVLNIIFSPKAWDNVHIGFAPFAGGIVSLTAYLGFEYYLYDFILKSSQNLKLQIFNEYFWYVIFVIILLEKFIYGFGSIYNWVNITSGFRIIPFYQPLSMRSFQHKILKKGNLSRDIDMKIKNTQLDYPKEILKIDKKEKVPDIYIFVVDAVRNEFVNQDVMPNVFKFSEENIRFNKHFSGGAATRYGIFSLFYGLNGIYWHSFLAEQKGSIFFDVLKEYDYQNNIVSSSNLSWPEFRKTAFVDVADSIKDDFTGEIWEKDKKTAEYFMEKLSTYEKDKPIFSFVFFDAPHGPYSYPVENTKFKPDNDGKLNYLSINERNKDIYMNQYFNAVNYDDMLIGRMIDKIKKERDYENSVIIIMSDHGEEFFECGNFGHNNAYSDEQTNSFLCMKYNKINKEYDKITSNVDIIPFLMEELGVKNPSEDYSNGENILNVHRDSVFLSKWSECAIKIRDYTAVFPYKAHKMNKMEIRKNKGYEIADKSKVSEFTLFIKEEMKKNSEFFK